MAGLIVPGRICVITQGSDAGKMVVVTKALDKNFVSISGQFVKERRANVKHLEPANRMTENVPKPEKREKKVKVKTEKKPIPKPALKKAEPKAAKKEEKPEAKPIKAAKKKEEIMVVG